MLAATALRSASLPEQVRQRLSSVVGTHQLELPVLPEVAQQVITLANKDGVDLRDLSELIKRDQGLAGNLMRLANSPLYAPPTPLVSLDQVVSRLGLAKVREMALIISCSGKVFSVPGHEATVRLQFRHSLTCGLISQEIARGRRMNVEEAFLGGMLHDIGRPVLLQAIVDFGREAQAKLEPGAIEGACSVLHEMVGSELIQRWTLPVRLAEAIRHHHEPSKAGSGAAGLSAVIALADDLSHLALAGPKHVTESQFRDHPVLDTLNLYDDELNVLLAKLPDIANQAKAMG